MRTKPTNRRGLLAGLAFAPAAAVAAPALAQPAGADSEILELGRQHRALADEAAAAMAKAEALWTAAQEQMPSLPAALDAWDAHKAAREAVYQASGYRAADAAADALDAELLRIERKIIDLKATTPAGWKVKARVVAASLGEPEGTYSDLALRSLLADLGAAPA